jgi:hypothetical protein
VATGAIRRQERGWDSVAVRACVQQQLFRRQWGTEGVDGEMPRNSGPSGCTVVGSHQERRTDAIRRGGEQLSDVPLQV